MASADKKLYTPKYVQIQDYILSEIRDGRLKTGDQIPSETALAQMFQVSRITVTTALKELSARGILTRVQGKGSFVKSIPSSDPATPAASQAGTSAIAFGGGIRLSPPEQAQQKAHQLLENRIISADAVLCKKLRLEAGSYVYQIVRCIEHDSAVQEMDFTYIPLSVCGGHTFDCADLETNLIHDYISRHFPEKPTNVDIYIQPELTGDIDISVMTGKDSSHDEIPLFFWDTVVRQNEKVLAVTTTVSKLHNEMKFLTLEIPAT